MKKLFFLLLSSLLAYAGLCFFLRWKVYHDV